MTDSRIQPGAFAWYAARGVGLVEETGGNPSVLFWADRQSGKAERIPANLLVPLAGHIPEADPPGRTGEGDPWKRLESGIRKAPLKLVALALSAGGNSGAAAEIRERLARRAPVGAWGSWWKRTEPKLGELPSHFRIDRVGGDTRYTLLSSVADVPSDWVAPKVTPADWKRWLSARTRESPPGRFPTKPVADALAKWPASTIDEALLRVALTAEELLSSGDVSSQVAEGWLRAVAQIAIRRRAIGGSDPRGYDAARVGALLARLARIAGDRTPQDLVLEAGALDGATDAWRRGFVAGLWESFEGDDAREMYRKSSSVLGRQARAGLAREIALAAFDPGYSARRSSELDHLLDLLSEEQRAQLLQEVVASASQAQKNGALDYIANSRHAAKSGDVPERLTLLALATLLLSDGEGPVPSQASRELADALTEAEAGGSAIRSLFRDSRARIAEERAGIADKLEQQRKTHEAELERERREQERLRERVQSLSAQMASGREESRVEIRQGMLLAVGDVLQRAYLQGKSAEDRLKNVITTLPSALREGGAATFGAVGDTVKYDPKLHHSSETIPTDAKVCLTAPGVKVGERVILKASVSTETEVC